jgi:hypothetical protein
VKTEGPPLWFFMGVLCLGFGCVLLALLTLAITGG